jgi:ABC-type antimicrobial peptide transport system permease subunit
LYGVLSHQVVQRTREIGIRIAVGAHRRQVIWVVMREMIGVVAAGVMAGLAAGAAVGRFTASLLFDVKLVDPVSMAAAIAVLALTAFPGALVPALRAARLDPSRVLREE